MAMMPEFFKLAELGFDSRGETPCHKNACTAKMALGTRHGIKSLESIFLRSDVRHCWSSFERDGKCFGNLEHVYTQDKASINSSDRVY